MTSCSPKGREGIKKNWLVYTVVQARLSENVSLQLIAIHPPPPPPPRLADNGPPRERLITEPRSCVEVEMAVQGSPSLIDLVVSVVSVDVKQHWIISEPRSCVKVEMAALGSPSLTALMVSVDVKQHWTIPRAQKLSWVPVPHSLYGLLGRKATLNLSSDTQSWGAVPMSPSLIALMVSLDVKQHWT